MPQKWPEKNRLDVIACIEAGLSCREAAARVGVSPATAVRWTQAAGLTSAHARRLAPEAREKLQAALSAGTRPADAAAAFGISVAAAARLAPRRARGREREALLDAVAGGQSRRQAAAALGLSVATAIRWARGIAPVGAVPSRLARPPRFRPDRERMRARLLEAIESGLSRRKAAAELGLPVATAIRWAQGAGRRAS